MQGTEIGHSTLLRCPNAVHHDPSADCHAQRTGFRGQPSPAGRCNQLLRDVKYGIDVSPTFYCLSVRASPDRTAGRRSRRSFSAEYRNSTSAAGPRPSGSALARPCGRIAHAFRRSTRRRSTPQATASNWSWIKEWRARRPLLSLPAVICAAREICTSYEPSCAI